MLRRLILLLALLGWSGLGMAQLDVNIGLNVPVYPQLVPVPGYPVYYAPSVNSNYFFYDGLYWVYHRDGWYQSAWYNGPWMGVPPEAVPLFVLRVPVRYYRRPPTFFLGWHRDGAPRWGEHWGREWESRHSGWDHWDRREVHHLAPLPVYQRQYSGSHYPHGEQQRALETRNYHYEARDATVRQHVQSNSAPAGSAGFAGHQAQQQHPQGNAPQAGAPGAQMHKGAPVQAQDKAAPARTGGFGNTASQKQSAPQGVMGSPGPGSAQQKSAQPQPSAQKSPSSQTPQVQQRAAQPQQQHQQAPQQHQQQTQQHQQQAPQQKQQQAPHPQQGQHKEQNKN